MKIQQVFIATGARVFNGAQMGRASSVALGRRITPVRAT